MFSEIFLNSIAKDEEIIVDTNIMSQQQEDYPHNLRNINSNVKNVESNVQSMDRHNLLRHLVEMRHASNSMIMHEEQTGRILTAEDFEVPILTRRYMTIAQDGNVYRLGVNVTKEEDLAATRDFLGDLVSFEQNDDVSVIPEPRLATRFLHSPQYHHHHHHHTHSHQSKPTKPSKSPPHQHHPSPPSPPSHHPPQSDESHETEDDNIPEKKRMKSFALLLRVDDIVNTDDNQSVGSKVVLESTIYSTSGNNIGRGYAVCTIVAEVMAQCDYSVVLTKNGVQVAQLHFKSKIPSLTYIPISVTGGTGVFSGAQGSAYEAAQDLNVPPGCDAGTDTNTNQCVSAVMYVTLYEYYDHKFPSSSAGCDFC